MNQPTPEMARLMELFASLSQAQQMPLDGIYTDDVSFDDPFHHIQGRENLRAYFERLNQNIQTCTFEFDEVIEQGAQGVVTWTMHLETRRPRTKVSLSGCTHVRYRDRLIAAHRDYFDAGELVYENVPLIGSAIRFIKRQV